jgi:ElaB/YqjD/DUF883 family membrane-anchored ribosome-binding protein
MAGQGRENPESQRGSQTSRIAGHATPPAPAQGGLAASAKETAQQFASNVAERAEDAWDTTRQSVQDYASTVASGAENAWDSATTFMRRYPVATFCAGFGLGCLLAMALENRYYIRRPD